MKIRNLIIVILFACLLGVLACSEDHAVTPEVLSQSEIDTLSLSSSMKGWELYCWNEEGEWNYSLMVGTNTLKDYEGVVANEIVVTGLSNFEGVLNKLPANEQIVLMSETWLDQIWMTSYYNLCLPSDDIITALDNTCKEQDLIFVVAQ